MRKGLSLVAAAVMLFNMACPAVSYAAEGEVLITASDEFIGFITSVNDGDDFSGKTITLQTDIELTSAIAPAKSFNGEFDGAGHTLSGLNITGSNPAALFDTLGADADVHDLTIEGIMSGTSAAALAVTNNGTIYGVKSLAFVEGTASAGGICVTNNGTIKNTVSAGSVAFDAAGTGSAGGICAVNNGTVEAGENKSAINLDAAGTGSYPENCGGIAGKNTGTISGSFNYSDVIGKSYIGGIAGYNKGNIIGSLNAGDIAASNDRAGGIAGNNDQGSITGCSNFGSVTVTRSTAGYRTGGIAGRSTGGEVSSSMNYGEIKGFQYIGGIAGDTKNNATINGCGNYGAVNAHEENFNNSNFAGGIAGELNGTATDCYNVSQTISAKWNFGSLVGKVTSGAVKNSYSVGTIKLIGSGTADESCTLKADHDDDKSRAATLDELNTLLKNDSVGEILLDADMEGDVEISRAVTIDGQGHRIGKVTAKADVTLKDLFVIGGISSSNNIKLGGLVSVSDVETAGITCKGDVTVGGALDFDSISVPLIAAGGTVTGAEHLFAGVGGYYFSREQQAVKTATLVVKKDDNTGLSYDIYPFIKGSDCYFFMPYSADLTAITYTIATKVEDEISEENATIDLSDGKTPEIELMGMTLTARAMVSGLPVLYLDIDEQYGSINAMNNSADHSELCYGDMRLEIPEEMAAVKGWATVYESIENDAGKNGTIELRGRGNSSWGQALRANGPRPYQLKLEKKLDLMGMGSAKTYTLLKSDQNQSYNKTFLDMGIAMGLKHTPQSEFVDVYMNGDYVGMYTLAEKVQINKERVNISDLEDEIDAANGDLSGIDLTGGYLVEIDNTPDDIQFMLHGNRITVKSPENLGTTIEDENYTYIKNLMTDLFDAVYGDGYLTKGIYVGKHFTEVLNMDSVTRYFLEQELSSNLDNGLGSTFFYKDKDSIDGKIYMDIVWDNDRCAGSNNREGWWLPKIIGYNEQDGFFRAMCQHKEFISYILAYYKDNINDNIIASVFKQYADIADANGAYVDTAAKMSRIRWGHTYAFDPEKLGKFIRARAAWVDANIDSIADFATKGEYIDVTSDPVEEPDHNPIDQPEDSHIVAGFRYGNGAAGTDLDASLGDKTAGYKATVGAKMDTALMFASVNGTNTKTVEWSKDAYADGEGSYVPAVVSASTKNMWDAPYVDIVMSTAGYGKLYFSAKLGATKKGPASYKLQYSLDGENYTDVAGAAGTLTKNKTIEKLFDGIRLPDEVCGKDNVHIRIAGAGDMAVSGSPLSANPSGGEFAVNDIFISDISGKAVDTEYTASANKIKTLVRNNTDAVISADIYTAVYCGNTLSAIFKTTQDIAIGGEYTADNAYELKENETVRIFCWEKDNMKPY